MKILIIEDEQKLAENIRVYLKKEGALVEVAHSLDQAFLKTEWNTYDCILVDVLLPDGNGLNVIQSLKKQNDTTGCIVVSARNSLEDKIKGLDIGADDYITKPFHLSELNARIKSLMRRKQHDGAQITTIGDLSIDLKACEVKIKDQLLTLTRKEYDLLHYCVVNKNRTITRNSIAEHLWGEYVIDNGSFDFIYSHMKNLRKKLTEAGLPELIKTVYGMGYKLDPEEASCI